MSGDADDRVEVTRSLVLRLRGGDDEAGRRLCELYRDRLLRFCAGYLPAGEVEDAVQEVFVNVLSARAVPDHVRAWLYRVARNHCLNRARARGRRRDAAALPSDADLAASMTGHLSGLLRREQQEAVLRALAGLSDGERELLRLRYTEELPREEIAELLELPVTLVKSRLYEALEKLRVRLR